MVQLVYSLLLAFQWRLWSKCMPYGFDHSKKTWTVPLQARFWAEGKHCAILKTTSQGSGGSGRQVLLFSQLYRWQLKLWEAEWLAWGSWYGRVLAAGMWTQAFLILRVCVSSPHRSASLGTTYCSLFWRTWHTVLSCVCFTKMLKRLSGW